MNRLNAQDRAGIATACGKMASPIVSCVVRVWIAAPDGIEWCETNVIGGLSVIVDRGRQTKIIRIFDLENFECLFEEELHTALNYTVALPHFHTFETTDVIVGMHFCDDNDANTFKSKIQAFMPKASEVKKSNADQMQSKQNQSMGSKFLGLFSRKHRRKSVEVSGPSGFQHKQHIGIGKDGFELSNIPDEWKSIFKSAGVRKKDLRNNPGLAQAVFDTIAKETGVTAAEALKQAPPKPKGRPPPRNKAPAPKKVGGPPPRRSGAPPPLARAGAPPPPARPSGAAPPPPSGAAPPPPPSGSPPPPPPIPANNGPPRPPSIPKIARSNGAPKPKPAAAAPSGGQNELLMAIRGGAKLKKTSDAPRPVAAIEPVKEQSMTDKLAMLVAARRGAMKEDEESSDDDDSDWD